MIKIYQTNMQTNEFEQIKSIQPNSWIDIVNPTDNEVSELAEKLILIDVPYKEKKHKNLLINTTPLAILTVRDEYIVTISKDNEILKAFKNQKIKDFFTYKKSRFTIQIFYHVATLYLRYLTMISKQIEYKVSDVNDTE